MKIYRFKVSNPWRLVLTIMLSLIIVIVILNMVGMNFVLFSNVYVRVTFFLLLLVVFSAFLVRLTSFAKMEVTFDDNAIYIKYLKQFLFCNKQNVIIPFNEIVTYIDKSDINWEWLTIKTIDGNILKIWHFSLFSNKFSDFVSAFILAVDNYNDTIKKNAAQTDLPIYPKPIKRAKPLFTPILAGFAIVVIVGIPILLILIPNSSNTNYFLLFAGYCGAIYFLLEVYKKRKKYKDNQ